MGATILRQARQPGNSQMNAAGGSKAGYLDMPALHIA
jgi:hypothetical protein